MTWQAGELPPFRLTTLFAFCADQSRVILVIWRFLEATSRSNNTAELTELTCFAEALKWTNFFIPRGEQVRILFHSMRFAGCPWCRPCLEKHCLSPQMQRTRVAVHRQTSHFGSPCFGHVGNARDKCADIAAGHERFRL